MLVLFLLLFLLCLPNPVIRISLGISGHRCIHCKVNITISKRIVRFIPITKLIKFGLEGFE